MRELPPLLPLLSLNFSLSSDLKHLRRGCCEPREQEFNIKMINLSIINATPIHEPLGGQCVNFPEILEIPTQELTR